MNNLEIISETPFGLVSFCLVKQQYQLAFRNMIIFIPTIEEYKKMNSFFQNMPPNCCGKHSHLRKKYVFGINGTNTFFAFDEQEMAELKKLLTDACFQIQIKELLTNN